VVLAVLAAVCFGLFLFVWRSAFFSTATVVFVVLSCLFQAVAFGKNQLNSRVSAILTVQNAYVKSAPADSAQDLYIIHEGTKLVIQETFSVWVKVALPDGRLGWIVEDSVQKYNHHFNLLLQKKILLLALLCLRKILSQILCFSFYVTEPFRLNTETAFFIRPIIWRCRLSVFEPQPRWCLCKFL